MSHGYAHLNLSPWANTKLGAADGLALDALANRLGASVSVVYSTINGGWTVHAWCGSQRSDYYGAKGALAVAIRAALADIEAQQTLVDDLPAGYTPEELVQIAAQGGMDVSRA